MIIKKSTNFSYNLSFFQSKHLSNTHCPNKHVSRFHFLQSMSISLKYEEEKKYFESYFFRYVRKVLHIAIMTGYSQHDQEYLD